MITPEIDQPSEIFNQKMLTLVNHSISDMQFANKCPPLCKLRKWELLFNINKDGISMNTFYKQTNKHAGTAIFIEDSHGTIFGGYASKKWRPSKYFYGTGETFLFTFKETEWIKAYKWNFNNEYFIFSDHNSIAIGGGYYIYSIKGIISV